MPHPSDLGLAQLPCCFAQPVRQLVVVIEDPVQDLPGPDREVIDVSLPFRAVPALRIPSGRKVPIYYVGKVLRVVDWPERLIIASICRALGVFTTWLNPVTASRKVI